MFLGVLSKELVLSDEPPLGSWHIEVETDNGNKNNKYFEIEKYGRRSLDVFPAKSPKLIHILVLPKFEVTIEPPAYSTIKDDLVLKLKAMYVFAKDAISEFNFLKAKFSYTYGKPVGGVAAVVAKNPWEGFTVGDESSAIETSVTLDKNGEVDVYHSKKAKQYYTICAIFRQ